MRPASTGHGVQRSARRGVCALLLLIASCTALAAEPAPATSADTRQRLERHLQEHPEDSKAQLELAQHLHDAAVAGESKAATKASSLLRSLLAQNPTNAVARAYLGSALTLQARDAVLPTTKLSLAREGFREMDTAALQAPDVIPVRLVRAMNGIAVPKMFNRNKLALEDFAWIHGQPLREGEYGGRLMRQRVALEYGRLLARLKNTDKAREVWQAGVGFDPASDSDIAKSLRRELETAGKP